MATGLPVIGSAVGGILEMVDDGRTGLLAQPGDAGGLADAICRLMDDTALASRLGMAARLQIEGRYSFDRMVMSFDDLYTTQLAGRGVAAAACAEPVAS
jgi:type III pantothenate kinase